MKKLKLIIFSVFCLFLFSSSLVLAQTDPAKTTLDGLDKTINKVPAYRDQPIQDYDEKFLAMKIGDIIALVLSFIGVLFLILIIFAGISWMTAGGNDQKVEKAKTLIINAVIGLLIVLSAYTITSFIGNQF